MKPSDSLTRDQLTFRVLRTLKGLSNKQAVENSTVSPSTVYKMRLPVKDGGTRHPQAFTLTRLLEAHGYTLAIVRKGNRR
jgi:transposase